MNPIAKYVENANRMMTYANVDSRGIELRFADGRHGLVPFGDIPEIKEWGNLADITLPNPYEVVLKSYTGEVVELPWDFVRHYCDVSYRPKVEMLGARGREALGNRLRRTRKRAGMTQEGLATAAGIGRVTLVSIESGDQSPRYDTLLAIADGLRCPIEELVTSYRGLVNDRRE